MTRKQAIKALFNQNLTETIFGAEAARANRILVKKRAAAKAKRTK